MATQYGYVGAYKPPNQQQRIQTSPLALAAAGKTSAANPFGFQTAKNTTGINGPTVAPPPIKKPVSAATSPVTSPIAKPVVNPTTLTPSAPPTPGGYDINTDPSLQEVTALTGQSDENAQAGALKQKQNLALGYGSSDFANALGLDPSFATAAAGNPTSALNQAAQQRDRNLKTLTDSLFQDNLGFSGYRVNQEQQASQDYENELAGLAGQYNSGADTISGNLASALGANQQSRIAAEQAARDRAVTAAVTNGTAGGTGTGGGGDPVINDPGNLGAAARIPQPLLNGSFTDPALATGGGEQQLLGGSFTVPSLATATAGLTPAQIAARNRRNAL